MHSQLVGLGLVELIAAQFVGAQQCDHRVLYCQYSTLWSENMLIRNAVDLIQDICASHAQSATIFLIWIYFNASDR